MWKPTSRVLLVGLVKVLLLFSGASLLMSTCRIPPRSLTATRMHVMKRRVIRFAQAHGHLPAAVDELPVLRGYDDSVRDGWWRRITMSVEGSRVTLTSLGRDNLPGGEGEDADMVGVFDARRADGGWQDELVEWAQDPVKSSRTSQ